MPPLLPTPSQATKESLGVRQKVKDQLIAATHQHKLRKDELQRHYDSAKMTDDKRAELEKVCSVEYPLSMRR